MTDPEPKPLGFAATLAEVLRIALPLLVSTGMFAITLFTDRTFLLWFDGTAMGASLASGNLFWAMICLPIGLVSMNGAIIAQFEGAGQSSLVGKMLWQSVWVGLMFSPLLVIAAVAAPALFRLAEQPAVLFDLEVDYFRLLLWGGLGMILETALCGFFSGTHRTAAIMWTSVAAALLNVILDYWFIFGGLGLPELGIHGAAIASSLSFWFKVIVYLGLLARPRWQREYAIRSGFRFDSALIKKLIYYGVPAGLHSVAEAGAFAWIILQIGRLGDFPLQATTLAIMFNMVSFIPLSGLQVATSVLVGRRLVQFGPDAARSAVRVTLGLAMIYCVLWSILYLGLPDILLDIYRLGGNAAESEAAMQLAKHLLKIVTAYLFLDAIQCVLAGALRGAGDTWFVLAAITGSSLSILVVATLLAPYFEGQLGDRSLYYWWIVMCCWVWSMAMALGLRYLSGRWSKRIMLSESQLAIIE